MDLRLLLLGLLGCNDYALEGGGDGAGGPAPRIAVDPPRVDFGELGAGTSAEATVVVSNTGDAVLSVETVTVEGAGFALVEPVSPFELDPGASRGVGLRFVAAGPGELPGAVTVASDDPETPRAGVPLVGFGLVPALEFEPSPYSFGGSLAGCSNETAITVRNAGYAPLTVSALLVSGPAFTQLATPELPLVLDPGEETAVAVGFGSEADGEYAGTLWATSDDPRGELSTAMSGWVGPVYPVEDVFEQPDAPYEKADILVWMDTSCSMEEVLGDLTDHTASLVAALVEQDLDYQLLAVTEQNGCESATFTPSNPPTAESLAAAFGTVTNSQTWENGLQAITNAVQNVDGGWECNDGFLREDASVSLLVVSDEPDQSYRPPEEYVAEIRALAPNAVISAVAGPFPNGCASAEPGEGYLEATRATGGAFVGICHTDWGEAFETLSTVASGLPTQFYLSRDASKDGEVEVEVNGVPVTSGWTFYAATDSVAFDADDAPPFGATVRIRYWAASTSCD